VSAHSTEQTTAVTDLMLAVFSGAGIFFLRGIESNPSELWKVHIWSATMGLIGLAATLGAVTHGVELSQGIHHRLWRVLNVALSLAVSLFVVGVVYDLWGPAVALRMLPVMVILGLGFCLLTWMVPGIFSFYIGYSVLALLFALGGYIFLALQGWLPGAGFMAAGVLISILAAAVQATKSVRLTLIWQFDHNGVYHLIQAVGLLFLLAGLGKSLLGD
jgi:hypothetical protein